VWGGEGINMAFHSNSAEMKRLEQIGVPTVIAAALSVSEHY
jgi:hypothetical protein